MKNKLLHGKIWLLITLVVMGSGVFAQHPLYLSGGVGIGVTDNYDNGTIPYHINGFTLIQDVDASYAWKRCQIQLDGRYSNSSFSNIGGNNLAIDAKVTFLYRCVDSKNNRLHYYTGGTLEGYGEQKHIPALMNTSTGTSMFFNLCDVNMVSYDFAFNKAKTHHWLTAQCKLTLPLVGVVNRPGFSYTSDGQGMDYYEWFFANQETFVKFFPGCSTDLGLFLNLPNGNRIGLNYRWDYLSTGRMGTWRYDNAYHTLSLSFLFKIN